MKLIVIFNTHLRRRLLISRRGCFVWYLRRIVSGYSVFNVLLAAESDKLLLGHSLGKHQNLPEHRNFLEFVLAFLSSCRYGPHNFIYVPVKLLCPSQNCPENKQTFARFLGVGNRAQKNVTPLQGKTPQPDSHLYCYKMYTKHCL